MTKKVYYISVDDISEELEDKDVEDFTDEEFKAESEKQEGVFSMEDFVVAFNHEDISTYGGYIRIL